jgi:predicted amidohydrolase
MKHRKAVIALAQIRYFDIKTRHNVEKILKYIKIAKKKGADIVCFPEACIYKTDSVDLDSKAMDLIKAECKKNSIWCIVTDDFEIKGKTYDVSVLIDRKGQVKAGYKKIHLYGDKYAQAGRNTIVVKTDFAKIGVAICWDIAYPELFKRMKEAGVEVVFCPAQWWYDSKAHGQGEDHGQREAKILESLILTRAFENLCFVAVCNPVMETKYQVSYSAIASPTKILKKIEGREGLITAEINLNLLKKLKKVFVED